MPAAPRHSLHHPELDGSSLTEVQCIRVSSTTSSLPPTSLPVLPSGSRERHSRCCHQGLQRLNPAAAIMHPSDFEQENHTTGLTVEEEVEDFGVDSGESDLEFGDDEEEEFDDEPLPLVPGSASYLQAHDATPKSGISPPQLPLQDIEALSGHLPPSEQHLTSPRRRLRLWSPSWYTPGHRVPPSSHDFAKNGAIGILKHKP